MTSMIEGLEKGVGKVGKDWKTLKKRKKREYEVSSRVWADHVKPRRRTIKSACYQVMEEAYAHTSENGRYAANARQLMYTVRRMVLERDLSDGKWYSDSATFTQDILQQYLNEECPGWSVAYDPRGNLIEPYTDEKVPLGTGDVSDYISRWTGGVPGIILECPKKIKTVGPENRFGHVLFIEKEGFHELLTQSGIMERYGIALMSTKGQPSTAARDLNTALAGVDVPVLCLTDFDFFGLQILNSLQNDTARYQHIGDGQVEGIGIRMTDVSEWGLSAEPCSHDKGTWQRAHRQALSYGATPEEADFLIQGGGRRGWYGERVEINAFISGDLIKFIERALDARGVKRVVPEGDDLVKGYEELAFAYEANKLIEKAADDVNKPTPPDKLLDRVNDAMEEDDVLTWDKAIYKILREDDGKDS